ncbi:MAG TPA: sigma-70 family RNA polymerase sigma factor [Thermoanaerobaculia bacterium]|nr:sigma-70 family RNA polymerase sigma factor [Thermoanaerobaculia bacterium]
MEQTDQPAVAGVLRVLAASREDAGAWDLLYRRFWPFVLAIAIRCVHDPDLAQDAAQDVFLRLARYCDFAEFEDRDEWIFRSYVARVAINTSRDALHRRNRRREYPLSEAGEATAANDPAAESELRLTLDWIASHLSASDAELVRKLADGATAREIATESNTAPGTVAVRIHRLRKRIFRIFTNR